MLSKNALLIVSNPKHIGRILPTVQKQVKNTLYIQLLSALSDPLGYFHPSFFTSWPKYSQTIYGIYTQAAAHCQDLDVRVLLSGLKYQNLAKIETNRIIDLIIFDKTHNQTDIDHFIKAKVGNIADKPHVLTLDAGKFDNFDPQVDDDKVYAHTVLGGTFDRLHIAHKLLLSEAVLRSNRKITVGVTEENMLKSKFLWELIQDLETRVKVVRDFLTDICSELKYNIVPISDPLGPAIVDPSMNLIIVSEETVKGGEKINEIRESRGLNKLQVFPVKLIDEPYRKPFEEVKISSSTCRIRLLGTLLKPVKDNSHLPKKPYVLGLTGGVASGKSGVAKWLSQHGAQVINCDIIGHEVYKPGRPCYKQLIENFGQTILTSEGEINRRVLGSIVFQDAEQLKKLNTIVWPAISEEVNCIIRRSVSNVIVVEAAVLITANWDQFCHEVWTTLVPREEAINRLKNRNRLSEEEAIARINSQPDNLTYVERANVVFCPYWDEIYTKEQVDKAWNLLQDRIL